MYDVIIILLKVVVEFLLKKNHNLLITCNLSGLGIVQPSKCSYLKIIWSVQKGYSSFWNTSPEIKNTVTLFLKVYSGFWPKSKADDYGLPNFPLQFQLNLMFCVVPCTRVGSGSVLQAGSSCILA